MDQCVRTPLCDTVWHHCVRTPLACQSLRPPPRPSIANKHRSIQTRSETRMFSIKPPCFRSFLPNQLLVGDWWWTFVFYLQLHPISLLFQCLDIFSNVTGLWLNPISFFSYNMLSHVDVLFLPTLQNHWGAWSVNTVESPTMYFWCQNFTEMSPKFNCFYSVHRGILMTLNVWQYLKVWENVPTPRASSLISLQWYLHRRLVCQCMENSEN